jgi:hypothetical protein
VSVRHRLFHAVVLVGLALPGCGSDDASPVPTDAASDTATHEDTAVVDSVVVVDSADAVVDSVADSSEAETCVGGCGDMCLPCIK